MCHEASGVALRQSIGVGKGTVKLEDFEHADAIFVLGQNPGTNHPRMLGDLRKAAQRGAKVVVFNPVRERGLERFADPQNKLEMLRGGSAEIASHYYPGAPRWGHGRRARHEQSSVRGGRRGAGRRPTVSAGSRVPRAAHRGVRRVPRQLWMRRAGNRSKISPA